MYLSKPKRTKRLRKSVNNKSELSTVLVKNKTKLSAAEVLKIKDIYGIVKGDTAYFNILGNALVFSSNREYMNGIMSYCKLEDAPSFYSITATYAININTVTGLKEQRNLLMKSPEFIFRLDISDVGGSLDDYNKYIDLVYKIDDPKLLRNSVEKRVNKVYNPVIGTVENAYTRNRIVRKIGIISADYVHSPIVTAKIKIIPRSLLDKKYQTFDYFPRNRFPFPF